MKSFIWQAGLGKETDSAPRGMYLRLLSECQKELTKLYQDHNGPRKCTEDFQVQDNILCHFINRNFLYTSLKLHSKYLSLVGSYCMLHSFSCQRSHTPTVKTICT